MPDTLLDVGCPTCGRPTVLLTTKSSTGAVQYSAGCVSHGRSTKNWYSSATSITVAVVVKASKRVKNTAPV